jgi:hypothetical protein
MAKGESPNKGHSNLIPPVLGEVRNPNGRPKGSKNTKTILERFLNLEMKQKNPFTQEVEDMTVLELMNLKQIANALEGDLASFKEIIDRHEGKVSQKTDITTGGEKIQSSAPNIKVTIVKPLEEDE